MSLDPVPADESSNLAHDVDEATLVARVRQGDRAAFYHIVQQHTDRLLRLAYGFLKSRADAEDVVQDLYLQIWRARVQWEPRGAIGSYLALSVRRRALDILKHRRVETAYAERAAVEAAADSDTSVSTPESALLTRDDHAKTAALLEQLPERFRMILLLRYAQQRSFAEIATILEISVPAARQLAHRALEQLRKLSAP